VANLDVSVLNAAESYQIALNERSSGRGGFSVALTLMSKNEGVW